VQLRATLLARWPGIKVTDWTEEHASYFRAIRIEKTMMALILLLIVAVAAFNIVAMLVMVVTDKRTDIAILRTLGASPRAVAGVFLAQGLVIGWLGVAAGVLLGVLIAGNVGPILDAVQSLTGFTLFDADVYYITAVPSELHRVDVLLVAGSALLVTALATLYPALRAAATSPAEALRYE
jgi:lipoprotein-releasing system permease protein